MTQKNNCNLHVVILLCTIAVASSFPYSLYASQLPHDISPSLMIDDEEPTTDEEDLEEEAKPKKKIVSSTKQIAAPEQPSFFTRMYLTVTPLILVTLNQALGTAIGAAAQSIMKQWMNRQTFKSLQENILEKAKTLVEKGAIDKPLQLTYAEEGIPVNVSEIPYATKLDFAKNILFHAHKIKNPEQMEQQTSVLSILRQATYIGMLNTIISMMAAWVGMGATMTLQSLMPAKNR